MTNALNLPLIAGARLPFTLNAVTATGAAPTDDNSADGNEVGRTIVWNWMIPQAHVDQDVVPDWLLAKFPSADPVTQSLNNWWTLTKPLISATTSGTSSITTTTVETLVNKAGPIIVFNDSPGTLNTHVWFRLNLTRNDVNRWFTCAEVEFYETAETATSARLTVRAKTAGAAGNSIATTETLAAGAWASTTLTGGADAFGNLLDGETVGVAGFVYTFVSGALDATGKVKIASTASGTAANFIQAINGGSGAGTQYATGSVANFSVTASSASTSGNISIVVTARSTLTATAANALGISSSSTQAFWRGSATTLTGGVDEIYLADPGFSFTSIVSAINQGAQGLDVQFTNETAELLLPDLRSGVWDKATATIRVIDWAAPSGGTITFFGGRVGQIIYDDTGFVTLTVDNLLSRKLPWPAEVWSPTCRAELGDHRCKFDIESLSRVATITTVVSQTEIQSKDLSATADYWQNGVIEILSGPNAGLAVELLYSASVGNSGATASGTFVKAHGFLELISSGSTSSTTTGSINIGPLQLTGTIFTIPQSSPQTTTTTWYYNPADGATVTINGKVYTFQHVLTNVDGHVEICGTPGGPATAHDARTTLERLGSAINTTNPGHYAPATTIHPTVAYDNPYDVGITLRARVPGAAGNALTLAVSSNSHIRRSGATLVGGVGVSPTGAAALTSGGYDTLKLASAFPFALSGGVTFKIWPGCMKRFHADCRDRFHNTLNFRGEPFAPTADNLKTQ